MSLAILTESGEVTIAFNLISGCNVISPRKTDSPLHIRTVIWLAVQRETFRALYYVGKHTTNTATVYCNIAFSSHTEVKSHTRRTKFPPYTFCDVSVSCSINVMAFVVVCKKNALHSYNFYLSFVIREASLRTSNDLVRGLGGV